MSAFYCGYHDRMEDSDYVGFHTVREDDHPYDVCDDGFDSLVDKNVPIFVLDGYEEIFVSSSVRE